MASTDIRTLKVVALAGGVGGAKLAFGLAQILPPENLTIEVNTGDDFEHFGLKICPDLDTVCYTLAGLANPDMGWGLGQETWRVSEALAKLNAPTWFQLGDRDLATHLERTRRLQMGESLSQVTRYLCEQWQIGHTVLPMSDQVVKTIVHTQNGQALDFQEYFVHQWCEPKVLSFEFLGVAEALPAPGILERLAESDLIVICPSNPWVSIDPILSVKGMRAALSHKTVIAVSPIVGGKALKGPAAKMYHELGIQPSATAVAEHYQELLSGFVFDNVDEREFENLAQWRIIPYVSDTVMRNDQDKTRLASEILTFGLNILNREANL